MAEIKKMNIAAGLDEDDAAENTEATEEQVEKRPAFAYWTVGGTDYRLKLNTEQITRLENKYGVNPMVLIEKEDSIPPLTTMLTIMQAALTPWNHGTRYDDVVKLYDKYVAEGGSQMDLYKVVMKVFVVSGFFAKSQVQSILTEIDQA